MQVRYSRKYSWRTFRDDSHKWIQNEITFEANTISEILEAEKQYEKFDNLEKSPIYKKVTFELEESEIEDILLQEKKEKSIDFRSGDVVYFFGAGADFGFLNINSFGLESAIVIEDSYEENGFIKIKVSDASDNEYVSEIDKNYAFRSINAARKFINDKF